MDLVTDSYRQTDNSIADDTLFESISKKYTIDVNGIDEDINIDATTNVESDQQSDSDFQSKIRNNTKLLLYSGHDATMVPILAVLGLYNGSLLLSCLLLLATLLQFFTSDCDDFFLFFCIR